MFALGFLLFLALSVGAFVASLAVVRRGAWEGTAERFLAAFMVWSTVILVPIHVLGLTQTLTRPNLAIASIVMSGAVFALAARPDFRGYAHYAATEMASYLRLPFRALALAWHGRSLLFLGVLLAYGVFAWTALISYLAPSDGWDGLWYHESMVGFAIQNHGYRIVEASEHITPINSFPRNCEMISLWFVFFTDRRLIDIVENVYAIPVMLALYCMTKRFCQDRLQAAAWACAFLAVPGVALQFHSAYVDIHALAFYLAALHFGTRLNIRIRDGLLTALCLGLMLGAKSWAVTWTPAIAFVALARVVYTHGRTRKRDTALLVAASVGIIGALGLIIYIRNTIHYGNPIWPYRVTLPIVHRELPGFEKLSSTDFNRSIGQVFEAILAPPQPGRDFPDTQQFGYGLAVPFVLVPMAGLTFLWILFNAAVAVRGRLSGDRGAFDPERHGARAVNLLWTLIPPIIGIVYSPALWLARYNYHVLAGIFIALSFLGKSLPRVSEGLMVVVFATGGMWLYWAKPAWFVDFGQVQALLHKDAEGRAASTTIGWSTAPETALARERELGPGDVVAYSDEVEFYANLWNERFSNRLEYVPPSPPDGMASRLDALGAKWFVTGSMVSAFDTRPGWQRVGNVSGMPVVAFRRVRAQ